ncbi:nitroreductase family protein [Bifidobacterium animalis]|uniref:nitroreductase family protein n=1 Tax=Bifidobacterium animalis TaxID=28025 RepID=UPI003F918F3F
MSVKQSVKKMVPQPVRNQIRRTREWNRTHRSADKQLRRFMSWISLDASTDKVHIETRLEFDIHRLEKGLSHQNLRLGFGKGVLKQITRRMTMLEHADPNYKHNALYLDALSALHEYQVRHEEQGFDLAAIKAIFPENIWNSAHSYIPDAEHHAGSFIMDNASKAHSAQKEFVDLAEGRHSVREYSDEPVSQETLDKVYAVSMRTPSVCNRQATRIHQISDPEIIKRALEIQGGFRSYKTPPVLLFVTSDVRAFMSGNERNEPFVDGGLFAMSLLYALEAFGLAACPLNAMFTDEVDEETRKLLNIPDYELPVMYIAVGNFPESVPICASIRKTPDEILTIIH